MHLSSRFDFINLKLESAVFSQWVWPVSNWLRHLDNVYRKILNIKSFFQTLSISGKAKGNFWRGRPPNLLTKNVPPTKFVNKETSLHLVVVQLQLALIC